MAGIEISSRIKLAAKKEGQDSTRIQVRGLEIGGDKIVIMAGPCSVESQEQLLDVASAVKEAGADMIRGGAFKPRTLPYSFQGLEEEGLKILAEARKLTGLPVVTEVVTPKDVELVESYADILQIGARNMQNYPLLKRVGKAGKPVMLKRALSATIEEWLGAAEYILAGGNGDVILCERGLRTFGKLTRFTLDLTAVPLLKEVTHLPVVVDPSHGTGHRALVGPMARAAVAAGADGLIVEVHNEPEKALSDGAQSLRPEGFVALMRGVRPVAEAVGRVI
jgi:3-deoxy-7-phosphoheptulonate synthase